MMLKQSREFLEKLKSSWDAGAIGDDYELILYSVAEAEFDSGMTNAGLISKIGAQTDYEERKLKSEYVKARVVQLKDRQKVIRPILQELSSALHQLQMLRGEYLKLTSEKLVKRIEPSIEDESFIIANINKNFENKVNDEEVSVRALILINLTFFAFITISFYNKLPIQYVVFPPIFGFITSILLWRSHKRTISKLIGHINTSLTDEEKIREDAIKKANKAFYDQESQIKVKSESIENLEVFIESLEVKLQSALR